MTFLKNLPEVWLKLPELWLKLPELWLKWAGSKEICGVIFATY